MAKHVIIYSHGFGVRKDDRGLFTDIAAALPDAEHVMFDYNVVDEAANALTVAPLDTQAGKLRAKVAEARAKYPDAIIDLVAHSQGCVVVALAQPDGIRTAIFTAPPTRVLDTEDKIREICQQYDISFTKEETVRLPRKDGSTTIIPPAYWRMRDVLDAQTLYNDFATKTDLAFITATNDEVLSNVVFDHLNPSIPVIELETGHNFEGEGRQQLIARINERLMP